MNQVETALMNNPVRSGIQSQYEARLLERLGRRLAGDRWLTRCFGGFVIGVAEGAG